MAARHTPHTMKHELLKAVSTGDAVLLEQVLGLQSSATVEQGEESCAVPSGLQRDGAFAAGRCS